MVGENTLTLADTGVNVEDEEMPEEALEMCQARDITWGVTVTEGTHCSIVSSTCITVSSSN